MSTVQERQQADQDDSDRFGPCTGRTANLIRAYVGTHRDTSCPNSCGGQPWTWADTSRGRRWRCDTCGRIVSRYVSDAVQAADDRRAL